MKHFIPSVPDECKADHVFAWGTKTVLHPIAGWIFRDVNGQRFKHITYVGRDGHLHDLVCQQGQQWKYNIDITAAGNELVQKLNAVQPGYSPLPVAKGNVSTSLFYSGSIPVPEILYSGVDPVYGTTINAAFPVGVGYFWRGDPGMPPDSDPDIGDGVGDGIGDPGGEPTPGVPPSPGGWDNAWVTAPSQGEPTGKPVAIFEVIDATHIIFFNGDFFESIGDANGWGGTETGHPIDISALAGSPSLGTDAAAFYWDADNTKHLFSIDPTGGVQELWSRVDLQAPGSEPWVAYDVLHEIPQGAPPAMPTDGSVAGYVFPDETKNVAYVDADGVHIHLCSHQLSGGWNISHISANAISPPPKSRPGLLQDQVGQPASLVAYVSDREHVIYNTFNGTIVDIWSIDGVSWNWGWPIQASNAAVLGSGGGGPLVPLANLGTGLAVFVWPDDGTDHIVYVGQDDGHIYELSLRQGSAIVPGSVSNPSSGLPWAAIDVTALVASDPRYSPPVAQ